MYPNPGTAAGWSPNGPASQQHQPPPPPQAGPPPGPHPHPHAQQQQQWQQPPVHPNVQYGQRPPPQIPPISQAVSQGPPAMATLQPSHPDHYRSLPPPPMYGHPPAGYPHHQQGLPYPPQPAPRQRTAIACRYCRRRKIRCSGFDQSEDGRCTNCQRFSQECVFTPVSAQSQAFVPAHTVWRNQGTPPQQLYGAYGQPLPQQHQMRDPYAPQQHPYAPPPGQPYSGQPVYPMPPSSGPPGQHPPGAAPPQQPGTPTPGPDPASRKRQNDEPHTPTLPPPNPAATAAQHAQHAQHPQHPQHPQHAQHRSSLEQPHYTYPDPTGLTPAAASPASSTTSFQSAQPTAQPYFAAQPPPRRPSPQSAYSYDQPRASSSPHNLSNSAQYTQSATSDPTSRPNHTPAPERSSPTNGQQGRGVRITELVGPTGQQQPAQPQQNHQQPPPPPPPPSAAPSQQAPGQQPPQANSQSSQAAQNAANQSESERGRSAADSNMLNQLNKQRM